jgi:hypothetical protein
MSDGVEQQTFPFMQFPLEIRRMIWKECLPRRVIEFERRTHNRDTVCQRTRTTSTNLKIPALAHVCSESRAVVLESGGSWTTLEFDKTGWLNPDRDVIFQHWKRKDGTHAEGVHFCDWDDMISANRKSAIPNVLQFRGRCQGMGVTADNFCVFYPSLNNRPEETPWQKGASWLIYHFDDYRKSNEWLVSMDMCIIHASPEAGRRSGLFALMGDAPVQLVDVADVERIALFRQLWASACPEDLEAECFFASVKGLPKRVQRWREKVEAVWVYNDWFKAYQTRFKHVSNPKEIWLGHRRRRKGGRCNRLRPEYLSTSHRRGPRYYDDYDLSYDVDLDQFSLNKDHSFVRDSLAAMPRLLPKIMFRHCTDNCHLPNSGRSSHLAVKGGGQDPASQQRGYGN